LAIGSSFWSSLGDGVTFSTEDAKLLRDVFHPRLSDRRQEGDRFTPPPTGASYMQKLKHLVEDEQIVRSHRMEHFHSAEFDMDAAGPLFPSSWTASFEIEQQSEKLAKRTEILQPCLDVEAEADLLQEALQSATAMFDKRAEDGMRFRVYKIGSLQVRTTQEHGGDETIGMVFSTCVPSQAVPFGRQAQSIKDHERIVKATEYVERTGSSVEFKSYAVLETEEGNSIVIEKTVVPWAENPASLDDRNSQAKVIRSQDCRDSGATVGIIRGIQAQELIKSSTRYVQAVYCHATGEAESFGCRSGFRRSIASCHPFRFSLASRAPSARSTP